MGLKPLMWHLMIRSLSLLVMVQRCLVKASVGIRSLVDVFLLHEVVISVEPRQSCYSWCIAIL